MHCSQLQDVFSHSDADTQHFAANPLSNGRSQNNNSNDVLQAAN
jgi:hypothetical protein